ncbi:sodium:solute symporter family transporter [Salinicoccus sediminis]|uniref:sodium:solute symporter family transporter n=1 Tax=Salinicoccus sediminis TaxID=1432562 RepID=UPI000AD379D7|nr:M24 family metallopeptidase [Salinicoccus sediminis]
MSSVWNAVSAVFSIFNWFFFAKRIRRLSEILKSITIPDLLSASFQDHSHVMRMVSIVVMTVFQTVYVCAQFVAFGVLFEVVLGVSFSVGVIVGGIITIIYTILGGFFAVALTDFIQGFLIAFALFILPILAIIEIGGFNRMGTLLDQPMETEFLQPFFGESLLTLAGLIGNQQIMATGGLTTMCHHRNGMTRLEYGEPLFICHCGTARFKSFYPGFDRTLFVGEVNKEAQKLLETAEKAQAAALNEVKPGAVAEDVHHAYAEVIQSAGYPIPFRAGRSIGFSVNEAPQPAYGDKTKLERGMTFAVDGGADGKNYRAQVGDSILITENGFEFLTPFTKEHSKLMVGR